MASFSDMFSDFPPAPDTFSVDHFREQDFNDEEEEENSGDCEESRKFWEAQNHLLEGTLYRSAALESKIRHLTKEAVKEIQMCGNFCSCRGSSVGSGCLNCLMKEVSGKLRGAGFNSAICRTKWRKSAHISSGDHSFIDVVDNSNPKRGEVRIIIDLSFRAQFEMARASQEYTALIQKLPQVLVGKVDKLEAVIKILCAAAKKFMKERKMHMGPWRKLKYVQAKWLGACERTSSLGGGMDFDRANVGVSGLKPKASMLRFDLMRAPVAVV